MINEHEKYFSNSREELEYYKNNYKLNAEELTSCKSIIKVLENINNKLKEKITQNSNNENSNDKSKLVFTQKEFKKQWETLIQTELIDSFDFCIKEYKLIANLCQDLMLLIYEETKKIIDLKFMEILKCMNLVKSSKDKKDSLYNKIAPFFRENFNNIFEFKEDKIKNIKDKLFSIIEQYNFLSEIKFDDNISNFELNEKKIQSNKDINEINNIMNILEDKIKGDNFELIIKSFFTICLYMLLHDPVLDFDIDKYSQRESIYCFYKKREHTNLEGFGDEKTPCIIILPPP